VEEIGIAEMMRGVFRASRISGCRSSSLELVVYVWLELLRRALSFGTRLSGPVPALRIGGSVAANISPPNMPR
jgi:hypothetical protein